MVFRYSRTILPYIKKNMTYYSSVYDVLFFRISLFFVLLYYLKSASCKCVFFRTRLIQDNNLGQG